MNHRWTVHENCGKSKKIVHIYKKIALKNTLKKEGGVGGGGGGTVLLAYPKATKVDTRSFSLVEIVQYV